MTIDGKKGTALRKNAYPQSLPLKEWDQTSGILYIHMTLMARTGGGSVPFRLSMARSCAQLRLHTCRRPAEIARILE